MKKHLALLILLTLCRSACAQESSHPPIQITGVRIERVVSSGGEWHRVVTLFETKPEWMDGVAFAVQVLLQPEKKKERVRVAIGQTSHANIPSGQHQTILYLSPSASLRFGPPKAVHVTAFTGDDEAGEFRWGEVEGLKKEDQERWPHLFPQVRGVLLLLPQTPFVLADYERMPDMLAR